MTYSVRFAPGYSQARIGSLLLLCLVCVFQGCGSGPSLYDLPGKVTVDGQAADGATIMFHPTDKKIQWVSTANSEPDGTFKVITDTRPGIPAGQYKVSVTWPDPAKRPDVSQISSGATEDAPDLLNGAFASPATSNLTVDVSSSMKELPPIEIKTK